MENIADFIKEDTCPLCGEKLTLYMNFMDAACFISEVKTNSMVRFKPLFKEYESINNIPPSLTIKFNKDITNMSFSSFDMLSDLRNRKVYLFYLCRKDALKKKSSYSNSFDFEINTRRICYYRSSVFMLTNMNEQKVLSISRDQEDEVGSSIISFETFTVKNEKEEIEKVYTLTLDHIAVKSKLQHYSFNKLKENEDPPVFEKYLPYLKNRFFYSDTTKDKLLYKMESWVTMS